MDLKKYVVELDNAYKEKRAEWQEMQDQLMNIQEKEKDVKSSSNSTVRKAADLEELQNEKREINQKLSDLQKSARKEFDAITEKFNGEIRDYFTVKPEDVDGSATMLLNSGALTDSDLYALVEKYSDNITMLKLIEKAAENNGSESARSLNAYIGAYVAPKERQDAFEGASLTVYRALSPNKDFANPNAEYWEKEQLNKIQNDLAGTEKLNIDRMKSFME